MNAGSSAKTSFRDATVYDTDALRQIELAIVNAERAFDPTLRAGPIGYYDLQGLLQAANAKVIVAERNNSLVGSGFARIDDAQTYVSHAKQAYLGLMFVDPRYRGQGINGQIVERLKTWCRSRGVMELRLQVYSDNLAAIGAYERAGFSKHVIEMRTRLPEA